VKSALALLFCTLLSSSVWAQEELPIPPTTPGELPLQEPAAEPTDSYLELWLIPSWEAIDWSTPKEVAKSLGQSVVGVLVGEYTTPEAKRSRMGHALIHMNCSPGADEPAQDVWTSLNGNLSNQLARQIVTDGLGMGALFTNQDDGVLLSSTEAKDAITRALKNNRRKPAFIRFAVGEAQCAAAFQHLAAFRGKVAMTEKLYYGFTADPDKHEGGSCGSFAESFLRKADAPHLDRILPEWQRELEIGESLIGDPEAGTRVGFYKVFMDASRRWAEEGEPTRALTIHDPQRIYDWIRDLRSCTRAPDHCPREELLDLIPELKSEAIDVELDGVTAWGVGVR
jgi:hypothetical protein